MDNSLKQLIKQLPIVSHIMSLTPWRRTAHQSHKTAFPGSSKYWEQRYAAGGNSGVGSYGGFATFKAEVLNAFVFENSIRDVIEFGCGDGHQLTLAEYPIYLGFDVSETAVVKCRRMFSSDSSKAFDMMDRYDGQVATLALSLDVIYHLVEDELFERHMYTLFRASTRYVIIYSSDCDDQPGHDHPHVRHRRASEWIRQHLPKWRMIGRIPNRFPYSGNVQNGSLAEFLIYECDE